jgi:hypothetical protein
MQAFQNHEARLQAESLPLLLPHAKKIDDLTKTASRIGLQILGLHGHIANEEGGRPAGSNAKGISEPKGTFGCLRESLERVPISTRRKWSTYTPSNSRPAVMATMITGRILEENSHLASLDVIVRVHELTLTPLTEPRRARPEGRRRCPTPVGSPGS